jgi:aromatic-L-amino-acid/L-tryptophan decarboxylase
MLMREPGLLERTFTLSGEYLRDTFGGEVNFRDRGIQLPRGTRALKLWLSVQVFGLDAFREAVEHGLKLAEHAEGGPAHPTRVDGRDTRPAGHRVLHPRRRRRLARVGSDRLRDWAAPWTTVLRGQTVLPLCRITPRTTFEEIEETIDRMERAATAAST